MMTLEQARKIADFAFEEGANRNLLKMTVVVTDVGGSLRVALRGDGVGLFGVDIAHAKATTALGLSRLPSGEQFGMTIWEVSEQFGIPPEMKVTYETYLSGVHPEDRHIVHETVARVGQPGSSGRFDIEYRTIGIADGQERWVAERGRAVVDSEGQVTRLIGTMLEIWPPFAVDGVRNIEIYALRAKSPEPPMPFWIREPMMCVELTLP